MTYSRQNPVFNGLVNLKSTATNPAFHTQDPALLDREGNLLPAGVVKTGFNTWLLSDIIKAVQDAFALVKSGYISTTVASIQAKYNDKFQIIESGDILLPTTLEDGGVVTVIDPYQKLRYQTNKAIAPSGVTIGKGQLATGTESESLSLQNNLGVQRLEFVCSAPQKNWAVTAWTVDGSLATNQLLTKTYKYTLDTDLQAAHEDLIEIDKPGKILLWNATAGQYVTITDGRGLLAMQDNVVVAPAGQTIGKGQLPEETNELHLGNNYYVQWFRLVKGNDNNWIINTVTK